MKNNNLLLSLCFLAFTSSTKAQLSIGLETGYNKNYLNTNESRPYTAYRLVEGFNIGVPVKYDINKWFAIQADPQFIRKGYNLTRTGSLDGFYDKVTSNYIQLPIMGNFSFGGEKLKGFLNMGGYAGYWMSARKKGFLYNFFPDPQYPTLYPGLPYNEKYEFDNKRDRRIELGLMAGAGISYQVSPIYQLFAETRLYQGLTDLQKSYMINQIPRYNQTYVVQIGCMYSFGK